LKRCGSVEVFGAAVAMGKSRARGRWGHYLKGERGRAGAGHHPKSYLQLNQRFSQVLLRIRSDFLLCLGFVSSPQSLHLAQVEAWSTRARGARDGVSGHHSARGWFWLAGGEQHEVGRRAWPMAAMRR
jgi:hypothetical protein